MRFGVTVSFYCGGERKRVLRGRDFNIWKYLLMLLYFTPIVLFSSF
jgi:hypothetical protein